MKPKLQIIELAKLDGRVWNVKAVGINLFATQLTYPPEGVGFVDEIKTYGDQRLATELEIEAAIQTEFNGLYHGDYLYSRDAIVPLIGEQGKEIGEQVIINLAHKLDIDSDWSEIEASLMILLATPQQLSEALLRACGKWKE